MPEGEVVDRNFRGRSGGRRDRDREDRVILRRGDPFETANVREFRVADNNPDRFRSVHRGSAANRNDAVGPAGLERSHACLNVFDRRIRLNIGENRVFEAGLIEKIGNLLRNAKLDQVRIGANESFPEPASG